MLNYQRVTLTAWHPMISVPASASLHVATHGWPRATAACQRRTPSSSWSSTFFGAWCTETGTIPAGCQETWSCRHFPGSMRQVEQGAKIGKSFYDALKPVWNKLQAQTCQHMSTYVNISKIIAAGKKKTQLGINKQWVEYDLPGGICCAIRCQLKDTPPAMRSAIWVCHKKPCWVSTASNRLAPIISYKLSAQYHIWSQL